MRSLSQTALSRVPLAGPHTPQMREYLMHALPLTQAWCALAQQSLPRKSGWPSYLRVLRRCCYDARDFTSSVRIQAGVWSKPCTFPGSAFSIHASSSQYQCLMYHISHGGQQCPPAGALIVLASCVGAEYEAGAPATGTRCIQDDGALCCAGLQLRRDCHRGREAERHQRECHPHQCVTYCPPFHSRACQSQCR